MTHTNHDHGRTALILAGGAALGAYEVGAVRYLVEEVAATLGEDLALDILSGTSAGALNAGFLAAHADTPRPRAERLAALWTSLRLHHVLKPSGLDILAMLLAGRHDCLPALRERRGGILDGRPLERVFRRHAPMERVAEHVRAGRLHALAISATHVASGRCVCFVQTAAPPPTWPDEVLLTPVPTEVRPAHVLASAAIPLLFPAVVVDGEAYCDGGLRQIVPLSPAVHLGADALVVVNPVPARSTGAPAGAARLASLASPIYLAGKALNALFLDRMEVDLARLEQVNDVLDAGERRFGPGFVDGLNRELAARGQNPLRPVRTLRLQPSQDIGRMAAEYVASAEFARRERGIAGRLLRMAGLGDPERGGDLLSYLLFDGAFAARLIDLGWADARAQHERLCELFATISRTRRRAAARSEAAARASR